MPGHYKMKNKAKPMKPKTAKKGKSKLQGLKPGSPAFMKALRDMKKK